jgi:hypothetical protein
MAGMVRPLVREVEYQGKTYRVDFSFNAILEVIDVLDDKTICDADKIDYACWRLVRGHVPQNAREGVFQAILGAIKGSGDDGEQAIEFGQDWPQIRAGFRQAYGIDLEKERGRMHWIEFRDLLANLPADTRMAETIDIRLRPMPKATKFNADERMALARAKAKVRIRNKQGSDFRSGLLSFAMNMKAWAERG